MKKITTLLIISCIVLSSTLLGQSALKERIENLDSYIEQARVQWNVPGLSVAIVKDGEVLLSKGYGIKGLSDPSPVDNKTLFMIGSTTKAMTAHAMGLLVDEGKIKWDDRVIDHLPWFKMNDPYVTEHLRIKDLFTHNSGLGNTDLLWVLWDYSTEEIVRRIRFKALSYEFRGGYTYQNVMYATAGLIIEKLADMEWKDYLKTKLWEPLGMHHTHGHRSDAWQIDNRARPHYPVDGQIVEIEDSNADSVDAAGSVWSNSDDMARWMNFLLNNETLLDSKTKKFLAEPQILIPRTQFYPTSSLTKPHFTSYGMAWFFHDYQGDLVQFHTGSLNGAIAVLGLLPEHNIGVYVLGNLDHAEVRHAIMYKAFDLLRGNEERDWSTLFKQLYDNIAKDSQSRAAANKTKPNLAAKPTYALKEYVGTYENEYLGKVEIGLENSKLKVTFRSDRHMTLTAWDGDNFMGSIDEYAAFEEGELITFQTSQGVKSVKIYGYDFKKQ